MKDIRYWNDAIESGQPVETKLFLSIAGTGSVVTLTSLSGPAIFPITDAAPTQATIDAFLGTTAEIDLLAFDATAIATDTFGLLVNMGGQVKDLIACRIESNSGTAGVTEVVNVMQPTAAGLTASTCASELAKGANGNIALRSVMTGFDALTAGVITITLYWMSK